MPGESRRVVILYDHPLLGEGLERLLRGRSGLEVQLVQVDGMDAARSALATKPDVVILERCAPVQAMNLLPLAPDALFIDVGLDAGPSWIYRRDELSPQPEDILRTIVERVAPAARWRRIARTAGSCVYRISTRRRMASGHSIDHDRHVDEGLRLGLYPSEPVAGSRPRRLAGRELVDGTH